MTQTNTPNPLQQVVSKENLFTSPWIIFFQGIYKTIRAKFNLNLSGILSVNISPVSNSGSAETNLMTYELPVNNMQNNSDILSIKASGVFAANGNNKTLKLKFGSQTILDTGAVAANGTSWEINATIIRNSQTVQTISTTIISNNSAFSINTTGTQDLSVSNIIKCTGQGSVTNDLTENSLIIGLTPND